MNLQEVVDKINELDENLTIYAVEPWSCSSEAEISVAPETGGLPDDLEAKGFQYFLEVFVAKEFLEGWAESVPAVVSSRERCERLITYARDDA